MVINFRNRLDKCMEQLTLKNASKALLLYFYEPGIPIPAKVRTQKQNPNMSP